MSDPFELSENEKDLSKPLPIDSESNQSLSYMKGLNDEQIRAVKAVAGPLLVLAGAGTGKTRVLTTRLAHILVQGKARPWEILAVTFTNKAAVEMQDRVAAITGKPVEGWWLGTFHALCARILRRHAELVGLKNNFTILDTDDQLRLLKKLIVGSGIDEKRWPARVLMGSIQRWKDRGLNPDKITNEEGSEFAEGVLVELYHDYQRRLKALNAVDFGDLLLQCLNLFTENGDVLHEYQRKFRYLLVDEYQDTNIAQYLWLRLLAQEHKNICCVGDDDQSIYSWRGAEVENILKFEKDFAGAAVIRLEQNYRSTPHILAVASGLISHNRDRLGKTLWTGENEGELVKVHGVWDGESEARLIGAEIEQRQNRGQNLEEIAILVRAGFQMREFEERMITLGITYRVIGGPRFYERQETRDAIAYLRVLNSPDDDLAFERIINIPKRGLGQATVQSIHKLVQTRNIPMYDAAQLIVETDEIKPKARSSLSGLLNDFERWRSNIEMLPHAELAEIILDESGYMDMLTRDKSLDAPGRLENLKELISGLGDFDNLQGFLEHVSLVMENRENNRENKVSLMTLHAAKGLEFETVFLPGWEEGLFPHQRSLDEDGLSGLEEERRLAYVGITRAKKEAVILYAANRRVYNQWQNPFPSRFIDELSAENIDHICDQGFSLEVGYQRIQEESRSKLTQETNNPPRVSPQERGFANDGTVLEDEARLVSSSPRESKFETGIRIFHQKFGYGKVLALDGDKLEVDFEKAGIKKVIDSFVDLA